jgi:O-antigen/teichoic acid export membrane protein
MLKTAQDAPREKIKQRTVSGHTVIFFTICRYAVYGMVLIRGLLSAKFLGPQLLGTFGFLCLLLQYLAYSGLGLQFAVNVKLATDPDREHSRSISTALTLTAMIAAFLIAAGAFVQVFGLALFSKYSFARYATIVGFIGGATLLQQVYTNIYRVYGRLAKVAITESFSAVILLLAVFFFRSDALLGAMLAGMALSAAFALVLFTYGAPFQISLSLDSAWIRPLLSLGLPLLLYNASFYLIPMVAQTTISICYPVVAMGYYTFATSVASAILLGYNSVSWIAFPNILTKTRAELSDKDVLRTTDRVNILFGTGVFLTVFAGLLLLPALFALLPSYAPSQGTLMVLLLSQGVLESCFGYNCLAIARKRQMSVAKISLTCVLAVGCLSALSSSLGLSIIWVAVAVFLGSLLFNVLQARLGMKLVPSAEERFRPVLTFSTLVAVAICIGSVFLSRPTLGAAVGSIVFAVGNRERIHELWGMSKPFVAGILRGPKSNGVAIGERI